MPKPPFKRETKTQAKFYLTDEAILLLGRSAEALGMSMSAVVNRLIVADLRRKMERRERNTEIDL